MKILSSDFIHNKVDWTHLLSQIYAPLNKWCPSLYTLHNKTFLKIYKNLKKHLRCGTLTQDHPSLVMSPHFSGLQHSGYSPLPSFPFPLLSSFEGDVRGFLNLIHICIHFKVKADTSQGASSVTEHFVQKPKQNTTPKDQCESPGVPEPRRDRETGMEHGR